MPSCNWLLTGADRGSRSTFRRAARTVRVRKSAVVARAQTRRERSIQSARARQSLIAALAAYCIQAAFRHQFCR
jgi:hypothetical protein